MSSWRIVTCALAFIVERAASLNLGGLRRGTFSAETAVAHDPVPRAAYKAVESGLSMGNWCVDGNCLTQWEKQYMDNNSALLAPGLDALRQPGCAPKSQRILVGGYQRTGSTQLFNQARLWMALAFPGNLMTGVSPRRDQLAMGFNNNSAMVVKVHTLTTQNTKDAVRAADFDVLLMSRRAVVDTVITRFDVNKLGKNDALLNKHVNPDDINLPDIETCCIESMNQQGEMYQSWEKTGKKVAYDVLLEDWLQNPEREIKGIAEALGVCQEARDNKEFLKFFLLVANTLRDHPGLGTKLTQMTGFQNRSGKELVRPKVTELLMQVPRCKEWADHGARIESNAMHLTGRYQHSSTPGSCR